MSIYILVETDRLEVSFTPANISVIDILIKSLYNPKMEDCDSTESFVLVNDLAVRSIVMLYHKTEVNNKIHYIITSIVINRTSRMQCSYIFIKLILNFNHKYLLTPKINAIYII